MASAGTGTGLVDCNSPIPALLNPFWPRGDVGNVKPYGGIAAVSRDANKLDVFIIGTNGGIYTAAWDQHVDNAKWRGWWRIGNGVATTNSGIAAVSRDANKLDVFVTGTNGGIYTAAWDQYVDNAQWRGWWHVTG